MAAYIFDFDGTLADSFDYVLDWLASQIKGSASASRHHADYRGLGLYELPLKLRAWPWLCPKLLSGGRRQMGRDMAKIKSFDGLPDVIKHLRLAGHKLFVVSANSSQNVEQFLKQQALADYFTAVRGGVIINKASAIRRLLQQYQLDPKQTWYVGDEAQDVSSARRAGVKTIAVTWGYNNLERLADQHPDRLIFDPAELLPNRKV